MNQGFRLRFDQMRESDPTHHEPDSENQDLQGGVYTRHLGLLWPNGRRALLNYAYLIKGEFDPGSEINQIALDFSSYTLTLQGYCLEPLFLALQDQIPRQITAIDRRYVVVDDSVEPQIIDMAISRKES